MFLYMHCTLYMYIEAHAYTCTYLCCGLLLCLVKLIQLEVLAGSGVEQGELADLPTLHTHMLQHLDGFQAGRQRQELELLTHLMEREGGHIGMHAWDKIVVSGSSKKMHL